MAPICDSQCIHPGVFFLSFWHTHPSNFSFQIIPYIWALYYSILTISTQALFIFYSLYVCCWGRQHLSKIIRLYLSRHFCSLREMLDLYMDQYMIQYTYCLNLVNLLVSLHKNVNLSSHIWFWNSSLFLSCLFASNLESECR